jgi:uncharacterized protein (UPF0303 family)
MTIDEVIAVLEMQEEILQFNHFSNEDAWALGNIIVIEAKKKSFDVAVSIRLNNGYTVFQYAGNTTNYNTELWMTRNYNTVRTLEKSSLLLYSELKKKDKTLEDISLEPKDYACGGGGFPIRIEDTGVIGAIIVSNQNHFVNHDILVKSLSRYLHIDEVPRIPTTVL